MKFIVPWKTRNEDGRRPYWWRWRGKRQAADMKKRIIFPYEEDLDHLGNVHKSHR